MHASYIFLSKLNIRLIEWLHHLMSLLPTIFLCLFIDNIFMLIWDSDSPNVWGELLQLLLLWNVKVGISLLAFLVRREQVLFRLRFFPFLSSRIRAFGIRSRLSQMVHVLPYWRESTTAILFYQDLRVIQLMLLILNLISCLNSSVLTRLSFSTCWRGSLRIRMRVLRVLLGWISWMRSYWLIHHKR